MCGLALVCVGLWMHLSHESLFYGVLLLDNPTSPFVILHRLAMMVFGVGCIVAAMGFVGGCGAATECVCFLICVRCLRLSTFNISTSNRYDLVTNPASWLP